MTDEKSVDESWKQQARAGQEPPAAPSDPPPPPEFSSLVASLATGALLALGADPEGKKKPGPPDLERAKFAIDLLDVLAAKTKGNLDPGEARHLAAVLHQLRLAFVEASRKDNPKS